MLPPFAGWSPADWERRLDASSQIVELGMGWDVTDFGSGRYRERGLLLFTLRNGTAGELAQGRGKLYAEKAMIVDPGQVTPLHFHWTKTEDIINRGGGNLAVQVYSSTPDGERGSDSVTVEIDGRWEVVDPGSTLLLTPGESITLRPRCYHSFWGERERVLVGEVSLVNDDQSDNRFFEPVGRFPSIDEDEAPFRLLVGDYEGLSRQGKS